MGQWPGSVSAAGPADAERGGLGTFDPATTNYAAVVGHAVTETTVTPTASDDGASYVIKLDGVADADGIIPLAVGSNVITVVVTAEDGENARTYTVTVTRAEAPPPAPVTVRLSPRPEQDSTKTDITIEWTDSGACGGEYLVAVYGDEELEVVLRDLGHHPAPATTRLRAELDLSWDRISSYDWWVGVTCTSGCRSVGKASFRSGLPGDA